MIFHSSLGLGAVWYVVLINCTEIFSPGEVQPQIFNLASHSKINPSLISFGDEPDGLTDEKQKRDQQKQIALCFHYIFLIFPGPSPISDYLKTN